MRLRTDCHRPRADLRNITQVRLLYHPLMLHVVAARPAKLQRSTYVADICPTIYLDNGRSWCTNSKGDRVLRVADLGAVHEEGYVVLARFEPGQGHTPACPVLRQAGGHPGSSPRRACTAKQYNTHPACRFHEEEQIQLMRGVLQRGSLSLALAATLADLTFIVSIRLSE